MQTRSLNRTEERVDGMRHRLTRSRCWPGHRFMEKTEATMDPDLDQRSDSAPSLAIAWSLPSRGALPLLLSIISPHLLSTSMVHRDNSAMSGRRVVVPPPGARPPPSFALH